MLWLLDNISCNVDLKVNVNIIKRVFAIVYLKFDILQTYQLASKFIDCDFRFLSHITFECMIS